MDQSAVEDAVRRVEGAVGVIGVIGVMPKRLGLKSFSLVQADRRLDGPTAHLPDFPGQDDSRRHGDMEDFGIGLFAGSVGGPTSVSLCLCERQMKRVSRLGV